MNLQAMQLTSGKVIPTKVKSVALALLAASSLSLMAVSLPAQAETATPVSAPAAKNPLSVHVLNLQTGVPSEGVTVLLDKMQDGKWVNLASGVTNKDGRIAALFPDAQITPGDYRVTFETGEYYAKHKQDTLFKEVPVIIHISQPGGHYHVPLLLSQYGYSTYRGS